MRVLITGSSGQIGTNLGLQLINMGIQVFGVDCRVNTWTTQITTLLQDLAAPYRDFRKGIGGVSYPPCDIVVHLAAHAKVHDLVLNPHMAMENINITFNVLEYCRFNRIPLIFASSREVYGDIHHYMTEEQQADFVFTESPYSASKISGEALVYSYARCYELKYIVFRFSNVYGRYDNDIKRMERVIPLFIHKIKNDEQVVIYGRDKFLDFTYVDDCVSGVLLGVEKLLSNSVVNQTINLAYGKGNTLIHMAELVANALEVKPTIRVEDAKRIGEVVHYVANIRKAQDLLGYQPKTPLEEGIKRAVAWSSSHSKSDI